MSVGEGIAFGLTACAMFAYLSAIVLASVRLRGRRR